LRVLYVWDKSVSQPKRAYTRHWWSHTQSHVVMEQSGATIWEIAEADKSSKAASAAKVDIRGSTQVVERGENGTWRHQKGLVDIRII